MNKRLTLLALAAGIGASAPALAQDELLPGNGTETVFFYNDPSTGGITGSPTLGADGFWKAMPGDLTVDPTGAASWIGIENHFIGSLDWTTGSVFWDIAIGGAHASTLGGGGATGPLVTENLVPDWFTSGSVSAILSIGDPGFPNPCSVSPTGCTNGAGGASPAICPPPVSGYVSSVTLTSPFPLAGDGLAAAALSHFAPAGMAVFTSTATCGLGDYDFSGAHSTNENQADVMLTAGDAYLSGFQIGASTGGAAASGPIADVPVCMPGTAFSYTSAGGNIQALTEDTAVFAAENGSSSVLLDTTGGTARLGATVKSLANVGALAFPAASPAFLTPPGPPGFFLGGLGATLLISPTGFFSATFGAWAGTGPVIGTDADGDTVPDDGAVSTTTLSLSPGGRTLVIQAFNVTGFGPITAVSTTAFQANAF